MAKGCDEALFVGKAIDGAGEKSLRAALESNSEMLNPSVLCIHRSASPLDSAHHWEKARHTEPECVPLCAL